MSNREWTIMIYMAGDNNLAVDMAYALEQIKAVAGDGPDCPNLFVYYDGNSPAIPTLYCDFSDAKRPKYARSFMVPDKLYDVPKKPNENAADKRSMLNFINWCLNDVEVIDSNGEVTYGRRANKYAFIISGHSLGFQDIGLFKDESTGKTMKMKDLYFTLRQAISTSKELTADGRLDGLSESDRKRESTVLLGQKFDILGFDACVMGMLEVGYQFSEIAKTMIASEGSVPSAGWTYAKILGNLARSSGDSNTVAKRFVRDFIRSQDAFTIGGSSVDMAAWDLTRFGDSGDLSKAFDGLAFFLTACFEQPGSRLYQQMERVVLQVHWKCQSYMFDQNVDLGDFCELLDLECGRVIEELEYAEDTDILLDLQKACRDVIAELEKAVVLSGFSGGDYQYSHGVSVFFPWSREGYEVSKKNYESLWFVKDLGSAKRYTWAGFLKKYLNEVTLRRTDRSLATTANSQRYRYYSGIPLDDEHRSVANDADTKLAGVDGSKLAGVDGSKLAGVDGSKLAGVDGSKLAGVDGSKLAGVDGSKLAGVDGSKLAGVDGSKLAGVDGSKLAGVDGSKLAGVDGSKLAGVDGSKLAGVDGSKLAGVDGSKLAGGSSNRFFDNLRLFKNIETPWDISGFTKDPGDDDQ